MSTSLLFALFLVACGGSETTPEVAEPTEEPAMDKAPETPKTPVAPAEGTVPSGAVFFVEPADGAEVTSPFKVVMGVKGLTVEPAGDIHDNAGHHHIIINEDAIATGTIVPKDATHIHYGDGSTETELTLDPGDYKLTLQFANGAHESYGEALSASIKVKVK